jgi:hypothetical protein
MAKKDSGKKSWGEIRSSGLVPLHFEASEGKSFKHKPRLLSDTNINTNG